MKKLFYFIALSLLMLACNGNKKAPQTETFTALAPAFSEDSAYAYVAAQCSFGPRTMNSKAHEDCGDWIAQKFAAFGATVINQYADAKLHDGTPIKMRNIIASFNPEAESRIIISGHWDSRPWADNDADEANWGKPIDGANDGASSIAVMLEMARNLTDTARMASPHRGGDTPKGERGSALGIDFICWDAEDSGTHGENSSNTWCLGSQHWASFRHVEGYTARYGINLDMVGSSKTVFYKEGVSMYYAPAVVERVWTIAQRLGYGNYFKNENGSEMIDDHLWLCRGGIPCIDIIGIDVEAGGFPSTWHTVDDDLQHIHKPTLKAVGQTILEVIWNER